MIVNDDRTRVIETAHATSTIRPFARLPRSPFVSIARAASLSCTTASRAIDELVMLGVLEPDIWIPKSDDWRDSMRFDIARTRSNLNHDTSREFCTVPRI